MGQNSSELLNSFIEEAEEIFKTANEKIEIAHKTGDVEDFAEEILIDLLSLSFLLCSIEI